MTEKESIMADMILRLINEVSQKEMALQFIKYVYENGDFDLIPIEIERVLDQP